MKRSAFVLVLAACALMFAAGPSDAGGWHSHVVIGVGPGFWWGAPYPYYWYPPPPAYYPPPVVSAEPPVYVERQPAPPVPPPPSAEWYYCSSAKEYYPNVQSCPEEWVRVPARPK
jgi:hypothetical protein